MSKHLIRDIIPLSFLVVNFTESGKVTSSIVDYVREKFGEQRQLQDAYKAIGNMTPDVANNIKSWEEWSKQIGTTNQRAIQFFKSVDNGGNSIRDLESHITTVSSLTANLGRALLNAATNFGVTLVAALAFRAAYAVWDHFAHRIENIKKASDEAKNSIQDLRDAFNNQKQLVSDVASSYEKLSKGVNLKTLENVGLSNDDYQEFLDINKQLGDAFPQLISTINENGDAVLTLGQNGRAASEDLKELLKQEEELQNYKIAENIEDLYAGVKVQIQETQAAAEELKKQAEETNKVIEDFKNPDLNDIFSFNGNIGNENDLKRLKIYQDAVNKFYNDLSAENKLKYQDILSPAALTPTYSGADGTAFQFVLNAVTLTDDEKTTLSALIKDEAGSVAFELKDSLGTAIAEQASNSSASDLAWKDFISSLVSAMKSKSSFKELGDVDPALQNIAVQLVQGLQSDVVDQMCDDPFSYIYTEILGPLTALGENDEVHQQVVNAFNKLLNLDSSDLAPDELNSYVDALIQQIATLLNKNPVELKVQLGFGGTDDLARNYTNAVNITKTQYGDQDKNYDWDGWFKRAKIDTQEEIDQWNKIRSECDDATEARKRYFKQNNVINRGGTLGQELDSISALSDGFEALEKIYDKMNNKKPFDFSSLTDSKFTKNFNIPELQDEYNDFMTTIAKSPKNFDACKASLDKLVTAYVYNSDAITNLNDDNAAAAQQYLELLGITNSEALVETELAQKHAAVALATMDLTAATEEEGNQLADSISKLADESESTDEAKRSFMLYAAEKLASNLAIDPKGDISALAAIVNTLGLATNAWIKYYQAKREMQAMDAAGLSVDASGSGYHTFYTDKNGNTLTDAEAASLRANGGLTYAHRVYGDAYKQRNDSIVNMAENLAKDFEEQAKTMAAYQPTGAKSSGGSNKGSGSKEGTEFDWIERKINIINEKIETTKSNIEQLVGYKDKNAETDTALDLMTQKLEILQQMSDAYMKSANEIGLSEDYINRIKNGDDFVEEIGDRDIADKVKKYQDLYDKAQDCTKQISDLNKEIKETALSELDNIIDQYDQLNDVLSKPLDTQLQILDWHKASGTMEVVADDYIALGETQKQIAQNAREEYDRLAEKMKKLNLKEGSDEWKKYNDQLIQCKQNMVSAAQAVEDYKDQMKDLVYKELTDYKSKMDSINNTISTMTDLIGDTKLVDETGKLTDRGLAQMALYAQQLANAKQEAAEYDEAIKSLADALDSGLITQDEYNSMLSDYRSSQESAVSATKDARDAIISLAKEGIQAEIDARKEQTDAAIEALDAEKDLHDYTESINEKQKNITTLQKKIAALSGATSGAELAQRLQLENDLADAQKDLYNTQYDHNREEQKKMLNDAYDAYEKEKNDEMDELDSNLAAQEKAINKYLSEVKANYKTAYKVLNQYGDEYNLSATEDLTTPWESGSSAANLCADAIGDAVANINYEISNIDISPLEELISAMQQLADYGISGSGDGTQSFKDVTGEGKWHKGSGGRYWYGNSNEDYVSGGIYTIEGQQYGFGDDGYMFEGWNNEYDGNWRYFQKKDGYMVKSDWVQDKGKWYYLDKNGAMLTDSVVKDKNDSNKYYYVDDNGVYDGKELTYDQVKAMGLKVGYRKGTKSADKGWHAEGEDGYELIEADDGTMLRNYHGGETVFTKAMTDNLWNFSKNPNMFVDDLKSSLATDVPMINNSMAQNININIPIAGNADMNTVNAIKEMLPEEMKKYATGPMFRDIQKAGRGYR
ncbi:hypothetical protein [Clostridium sp. AF32-12BH]|uniref:hypothetical protein n=1 Tax=Clostridium sp. AF32-12BH TaxID=2292006 RepID=UPI000E4CF181|nr:hypothetical protein [Clostridium sp. AF32-12BH]RHP47073.1 hypothetical protein DWZ40_09225 [Clostridium sp. AF32-12BH]